MCTLMIGRDRPAGTVLVAANRDEDPARPSERPRVLSAHPPLAGGRDDRAGGSWLVVRGDAMAVAMLNRRGETPAGALRSRGMLTLEAAAAPLDAAPSAAAAEFERAAGVESAGLERAALRVAVAAVARDPYAPFSLVVASLEASWVLAWDGRAVHIRAIPSGWHVLTHAELDDADEPRTAWLGRTLKDERPESVEMAIQRLARRLASHGEDGGPPVCLHDGRMVTVSSAIVAFAPDGTRYRHAEGQPCEAPFEDVATLLTHEPRRPREPRSGAA